MNNIENITLKNSELFKIKNIPDISVGDTIKVTIFLELPKKIDDGEKKAKERIQMFEGVIISRHKDPRKVDSTITVRKMFQGGGVEKVFVLNSPWVKNIEIIRKSKVKRAKLYYLRTRTGKSARLKTRF